MTVRPALAVVASLSWTRTRRTLLTLSLALPLAACERSSSVTEPEFDAPAPKRNAVCVLTDSAGAVVAVAPTDGSGGCEDGFDVRIWN